MLLQIKTHNYDMLEGSIPVALIFKIHYKVMFSAFASKHKFQSQKGKTLLLQTDLSRSNTVIPKATNGKTYPYQKIGSLKVQHHQNYHHHLNPMSKLKKLPNIQIEKSNCLSTNTLQVPDSQKPLPLPVQ